ncbi:MAG: two-component system, OmpR family, phosphate regulon response regulator PhoB [Candidatus Magnetoglobus multicellularis str. Araruama]|uniref:Two-component system, OmpR family, phosphate regulon response regulator PhoB n=1 Tax=Candidatus Magnetoglobus multicellularis str. Araruama TaxID=890399 RepID=A0A1V1PAW0_9BACT|nr:MAG: two-component system, OmpR family, phosphate regulon response regulator PhoB [Candidatus Magnetoglobus multicellularis str. Araruama]
MGKQKILIVDDEEDILELLRYNLTREGYIIISAMSGEDAIKKGVADSPDLILLDLMLPGIDGLEATKRLKNNHKTSDIPIIMLTAKGEEADVVTGLELGADDYITKPFSPRVVIARLKAVLRRKERQNSKNSEVIKIHDLTIHMGMRSVLIKNAPVELTYSQFQILSYLAGRPGWVFTRTQIVDAIRGDDYPVTDRSVDTQIVGLRKKLGECGNYIETVRGVGYKFKETI